MNALTPSIDNLIQPTLMRDIFGYFVPGFIFCAVYYIFSGMSSSLILYTTGLMQIWISIAIVVASYFMGKLGVLLIDCIYSSVSLIVHAILWIYKCRMRKASILKSIRNSIHVELEPIPIDNKYNIAYSELLALCQEVPAVGDYLERNIIHQIFCKSGLGLSILLAVMLIPQLGTVFVVVGVAFLFLIDHIVSQESSREMQVDMAMLSEKRKQGKL